MLMQTIPLWHTLGWLTHSLISGDTLVTYENTLFIDFTQNDLFLIIFEENLCNHSITSRNICIQTDPLKMTKNAVVYLPGLSGAL